MIVIKLRYFVRDVDIKMIPFPTLVREKKRLNLDQRKSF